MINKCRIVSSNFNILLLFSNNSKNDKKIKSVGIKNTAPQTIPSDVKLKQQYKKYNTAIRNEINSNTVKNMF